MVLGLRFRIRGLGCFVLGLIASFCPRIHTDSYVF